MQCNVTLFIPQGALSFLGWERIPRIQVPNLEHTVHFRIFIARFMMSHRRNAGFWHLCGYSDLISAEIGGVQMNAHAVSANSFLCVPRTPSACNLCAGRKAWLLSLVI